MADGTLVSRWIAACLGAMDALVFPWACRICGREGPASPFCDDCRLELLDASGPACPRCALRLGPWSDVRGGCWKCRGRRLGFDAAVALGPYEGSIRDLCLELKQERNAWLASWMADLLIEARRTPIGEAAGDCVAPIPLHWRRRMARGYNQAEALAARLAGRLGLPLIRPLRRVVRTPALATKSRVERAKLLQGAFRVRGGRVLAGRTVILVDDIMTTGATCGMAARALKRAGAARVVAVVIARSEGKV